jgi:hypothetical protein
VVVLLAVALLPAAPASAGRLLVTGHDADLHCADGGQQCHFVKVALDYVRGGAPNPSAPVLVLDRLDLEQIGRAFDEGRPVVIRAESEEEVLAALRRPEVSSVIVPPELADLDLVELTYG